MKKETKKEIKVIAIVCAIVTTFILIMSNCTEHYSDEDLHRWHSHGTREILTRQFGRYWQDFALKETITIHHGNYSEQETVYHGIVYALKPFEDTYYASVFADENLYNYDGTRKRYYNEEGHAYYIDLGEYQALDPETQALYGWIENPY